MALTEVYEATGVYDVTCDQTWCTTRYQSASELSAESMRYLAAHDGWVCDASGDWCPAHAHMRAPLSDIDGRRWIDTLPIMERGYSRPLGESAQTTIDALTSAIAAFHEGVTAQLDQRRGYIEEMAAAYFAHSAIPPEDAVLVEQRDGFTTRWWFEAKGER